MQTLCLTTSELAAVAAGESVPPDWLDHLAGCERCRAALHPGSTTEASSEPHRPFDAKPDVVPFEEPGRYVRQLDPDGAPTVLGTGGYARVLLARDQVIGRDVALKQLRHKHLVGPRRALTERRLLQEARVVGQLEHPSIVPLHDLARTDEGELFYVMRRVRGRTLAEAIKAAGELEGRLRLLPHVLAACHAVAFAHSRGVLHRDLKPHNVMVDRFGETLVIDWGLASARHEEDDDDESSSVIRLVSGAETVSDGRGRLGTPAYMSPEQRAGTRALLDERSDVFGLGGILFEVLTGKAPLEDVPLRPAPVRSLEPAVPADLAALCDKALAANPDARYQTAEALAHDLDAWLHGQRVTAHTYGPLELLRRVVRQHRLTVTISAVALVALAAVTTAAVVGIRNERNEARSLALLLSEDFLTRLRVRRGDPAQAALVAKLGRWLTADQGDSGRAALAWAEFLTRSELDLETREVAAQKCLAVLEGHADDALSLAAELRCRTYLEQETGRPWADQLPVLLANWERGEQWPTRELPLVSARADLAAALSTAYTALGQAPEALEWAQRSGVLARELVEREPARAGHWARLWATTYFLMLSRLNLLDGPGALAAAEESLHAAQRGHVLSLSADSAFQVADAWGALRMVMRYFPELTTAARRDEASRTARRQLEALHEFDPDNIVVAARLAEVLLADGAVAEGWALVAPAPHDPMVSGWLALLSDHRADALGLMGSVSADRRGFDVAVIEGLAHELEGDPARAAQGFEEAAAAPFVGNWPVDVMPGWAASRDAALRSLVEELNLAQRQNDGARAKQALLAHAAALRARK